MGRCGTLVLLAWATVVPFGLVTRAIAQPGAAEAGRLKTQVVAHGPTFWVYTLDTTSGRVWFLDRRQDGVWQWADDAAAPDSPGPVGKYELVAFADDKGAHVYVSDTTTSRLWLLDEENLQWLPRGAPLPGGRDTADERPAAGEGVTPGRFRAQVVADGQAFWVCTAAELNIPITGRVPLRHSRVLQRVWWPCRSRSRRPTSPFQAPVGDLRR